MKYYVYRQGPDERAVPSNVPSLSDPWVLVGTVERDEEPARVNWSSAVYELTGKKLSTESSVYSTWYKVLSEEVVHESD